MLDAIKFEHTVFALPFAYIAMVLAAGGWPGWRTLGWVTAAMVGGRTCAMAANRVVDRAIDAANPRTAGRHLPTGSLGVCDGIAAAGGWIAVRGAFDTPALVLWFALTVWIAGFDLLYACQDVDVDRAQGLHSVPARFGVGPALVTARVNHALTAAALALLGWLTGLGLAYWAGWLAVVTLLVYEHSLVSPRDLSRLDVAFFNVNGYIALIVLVSVVAGLYI